MFIDRLIVNIKKYDFRCSYISRQDHYSLLSLYNILISINS